MTSKYIYPEKQELTAEFVAPPVMHQRYQIVIPCFDEDQANRISEKVADICGHYVEVFCGMTDRECQQILGEIVMTRKAVALNEVAAP